MKVEDIMSTNVVTAGVKDSIYNVAQKMRNHNIGCIPVVDNTDAVKGMITDRDIALSFAKFGEGTSRVPAEQVMSNKVYSVKPDADTSYALDLMQKQQIRRLAVMENNFLLGMISIGDIAVKDKCKMEISEALTEISKPTF